MKITDFFKDNNIDLDKTFLVAASAGPDSMALLDMLRKMNVKVMAAHFDHQLRADSKDETALLKRYCQKYDIPLFTAMWTEEKPAKGIEAAARNARYDFLTKVAKKEKADYLLTAHHGDDLLENILLKFIRSGNPEEMNSLQAVGKMYGVPLLRPLLAYSKRELLNYDEQNGIEFITDSTNNEDETMRNRLRHHVVPLLKKENPDLIANALNYSQKMTKLDDFVNQKVTEIGQLEPFLRRAYRIKSEKLAKLSKEEQIIFWQKNIWDKFHRRVNQNLGNFTVLEYQGYFYLFKNGQLNADVQPIKLNLPFKFQNEAFVLTDRPEKDKVEIGNFWFKEKADFKAGSLMPGAKLLLQDGKRTKAKKKFAEHAIPLPLRSLCLTIYANDEPIFVEQTYQNQNWIENGNQYFLYKY
ncbi:tRNA lysidine(34) synthetase TilS [uncultured Lactobacillus sp.]|uniref:tRNA lysidine(34) synthetase TilS n=1 Tax=uncultured Lactobacillus sp. TaxID=153152 RepID=UPI0028046F7E|nr:tRNA lysidine(34) synthetase TilS [uncultured Lactobacillus sp.]